MAKKTRKPNLPQETLERARKELYGGGAPVAQQPAAENTTTKPAASRPIGRKSASVLTVGQVDLSQDYAYVITDLQNMGILAAVLMIVLVIMSFFI